LNIVKGNVEDAGFINKMTKGQDVIFHLAALIGIPYSYQAPMSYVNTNVIGTLNVLEATKLNNIPLLISTSTSETYGSAIYTPIDEIHPLQGQSPYSATKIAADKLVESYYNSFNLPVINIRPFNTFGPRQSARAVIPTIISQLLTKNKLYLGDLSPIRDFTFVEDTARGFVLAAKENKNIGEVINLGYGQGISVGDIANLLIEIMGLKKNICIDKKRIRPEKSEVLHLISDNQKAKELLGWEPKISLKKGLEKTINFISSNIDLFKSDTYNI